MRSVPMGEWPCDSWSRTEPSEYRVTLRSKSLAVVSRGSAAVDRFSYATRGIYMDNLKGKNEQTEKNKKNEKNGSGEGECGAHEVLANRFMDQTSDCERDERKAEKDIFETNLQKQLEMLNQAQRMGSIEDEESLIFKRRSSISRTPPKAKIVTPLLAEKKTQGSEEYDPWVDEDIHTSPIFGLEQRHVNAGTKAPVEFMDEGEDVIQSQHKRKRLESPTTNETGSGKGRPIKELREMNAVMAKLVKKSKILSRMVGESTKTRLDIKSATKELGSLIQVLEKEFKIFQREHVCSRSESKRAGETRTVEMQTDPIINSISIGIQTNSADIESEKQKKLEKTRADIIKAKETGKGFGDIVGVLDESWPDDIYTKTQIRPLTAENLNSDGDYAVLMDPTAIDGDRTFEKISLKFPNVYELTRNNEGQINYLVNTVATTIKNQEKMEKTTALYTLPLKPLADGIDKMEDLYKMLEMFKDEMSVHPTDKVNILLHERLSASYLRKICECVFYNTEVNITVMTIGNATKKQKIKPSKPEVGKVVVKKGDSTYADLLKAVKSNVDINKVGVQVASIRKTGSGDMLLCVEGGKKKADILKEAISKKVGNAVKVTNNETTLHILDIDATTTQEEVVKAVRGVLGDLDPSAVKFRSMRPSRDGNQIATIQIDRANARRLIQMRVIRIGWIGCRVKERVTVIRCFRCLNFGHRIADCKGQDRSDTCLNCNKTGHRARECNNKQFCPSCQTDDHRADTTKCPHFRRLLRAQTNPNNGKTATN